MALQESGPISFSQIINEFGPSDVTPEFPSKASLGKYRVSENIGSLLNMPLDAGVPQSGTIKFSDFYNKRLNIVVDFHSGDNELRVNGRTRYIDNGVRVIGGFIGRPDSSSGKKVFINVNKYLGSTKSQFINNSYWETRYVALRTGSWDEQTTLQVDVGGRGYVFGAGGDGGIGGSEVSGVTPGTPGTPGTSALGIEYSGTVINNRGYISCGYGGGGGGGCGSSDPDKNPRDFGAAGGGGGGGGGYPIGNGAPGGRGGVVGIRPVAAGGPGNNSGFFPGQPLSDGREIRGGGGNGGSNPGCRGGGGGAGGDRFTGGAGGGGRGSGGVGPTTGGGSGGANGYSILSSAGVTYSLTTFPGAATNGSQVPEGGVL